MAAQEADEIPERMFCRCGRYRSDGAMDFTRIQRDFEQFFLGGAEYPDDAEDKMLM